MIFLRRLIAIPTFLIGLLAALIFSSSDIPKAPDAPNDGPPAAIRIDACDLGSRFVGKRIIVEATIWSTGDHVIVYPISYCHDGWNGFIFTDLDLTNYIGRDRGLADILQGKRFTNEVDVRIEGTVKRSPLKRDSFNRIIGPSGFDYTIEPTDIEIISPLRKFTPKAAA
ncbi:MAG: hypothetical protein ABI999_00320 [Acidobacteriota bacterium]